MSGSSILTRRVRADCVCAFSLRPRHQFLERVVYDHEHVLSRWLVHVVARMLEPPHPAIASLEQQYNPERELQQIARRYRLGSSAQSPSANGYSSSFELAHLQRRFFASCSELEKSKYTVEAWLSAVDEVRKPGRDTNSAA